MSLRFHRWQQTQLSLSSALHVDLAFLLWVFRLPSYPPSTHHAAPGRLPCRSRSCILGDGHRCFFAEFGYPFLSCFLENISEASGFQIVPSCLFLPTFVLPASPVLSQVPLTLSFNLCILILAVIFSTLSNFFFLQCPFSAADTVLGENSLLITDLQLQK